MGLPLKPESCKILGTSRWKWQFTSIYPSSNLESSLFLSKMSILEGHASFSNTQMDAKGSCNLKCIRVSCKKSSLSPLVEGVDFFTWNRWAQDTEPAKLITEEKWIVSASPKSDPIHVPGAEVGAFFLRAALTFGAKQKKLGLMISLLKPTNVQSLHYF